MGDEVTEARQIARDMGQAGSHVGGSDLGVGTKIRVGWLSSNVPHEDIGITP